MSIDRRRTKSGIRYDVRLRGPSGEPYKRTFRTKREAEAFQAREMADRSRGVWVDPRGAQVTFGKWAATWLAGDATKRSRTRYDDAGIIRRHLDPVLAPYPLGAVTPLDVQRLVSSWCASAAPATTRRRYAVLHAIFAAALDADLLGRNPCRSVRLPAVPHTERHIVSPDELERLAAVVEPGYRPMVYLAAVLGLRWGECAALRVGRLDLLRRTLTVAESLSETAGRVTFGPPKSAAGRRRLTMPSPLAAMLTEHLAYRQLTAANPEALVFPAPGSGPLRASNFRRRVWLPATRASGLTGLRFHDLRHAAASALVTMGVDLRTAQARLGHADPRLTLAVYAHASEESDRRAAEVVGAHFMAAPGGSDAERSSPVPGTVSV